MPLDGFLSRPILTAHIAQRKDGESSHAHELPHWLPHHFSSDKDRVCMRCLLDRPGAKRSLEKQDPYTYACAACHAETEAECPMDERSYTTLLFDYRSVRKHW